MVRQQQGDAVPGGLRGFQCRQPNKDWIARFDAEASRLAGGEPVAAAAEATPSGDVSNFAGLYDRFIADLPAENSPSPLVALIGATRSRQLFNAIIEQNCALFENARVLEFPSADGRCGLAALDAGAASMVGIEPKPRLAEEAARTFAEYGVTREPYEFINADVLSPWHASSRNRST